MEHVAALRVLQLADPARYQALLAVKRVQSERFRFSHADLIADQRYSAACHFFLTELYGDKDFADRDTQFSRVASTLQRLFDAEIVELAVNMSLLHRLTEDLDDAMAREWVQLPSDCSSSWRYVQAWRKVGHRASRDRQVQMVLHLGAGLDHLTRNAGLRLALRLMRGPAAFAGLSALQGFLERGFDIFAAMKGAQIFLQTIEDRETDWISRLFEGAIADCQGVIGLALTNNTP